MNKPVVAGHLAEALYWSVRDGKSIDNIPGLIKQLLEDDLWKEIYVKEIDQIKTFNSFEELIVTPPPEGIGTTFDTIKRLISNDAETLNLLDEAVKNPVGVNQYTKPVYNINKQRPTGTSKQAGLRRLRKDRPDLLEQVINNEKSVNAAMIEAGFRKKTISCSLDVNSMANVIINNFNEDEIEQLIELLNSYQ